MSDARETAANLFDRTAKLARTASKGTPDPAGAVLLVASGIAAAVAALIRNLGVDGAAEAISDLAARRDEGAITPADVIADDAGIVDAVSSMYRDEAKAKADAEADDDEDREAADEE